MSHIASTRIASTWSRAATLVALFAALCLLALSCGSDGPAAVTVGDSGTASSPADGTTPDDAPTGAETPIPVEPDGGIGDGAEPPTGTETPIPVEPDGGIGDGAEPLPGAETPIPVEPDGGIGDGAEPLPGAQTPTIDREWHGRALAETNCPGTTWQRVEASAFSFSVPVDFVDLQPHGIDSEVGGWSNGSGIEVAYDYGWYAGPLSQFPGIETTEIDYGGITGRFGVARAGTRGATDNVVGVHFPQVAAEAGQWNALGLIVFHDDPADEIIGRCIVGSIEWSDAA